jgi:hypothetical protein
MQKTIAEDYTKTVCTPGQGARSCRYLNFGEDGWECLKLTDAKDHLDAKALAGRMVAQSDNCTGIKMKGTL